MIDCGLKERVSCGGNLFLFSFLLLRDQKCEWGEIRSLWASPPPSSVAEVTSCFKVKLLLSWLSCHRLCKCFKKSIASNMCEVLWLMNKKNPSNFRLSWYASRQSCDDWQRGSYYSGSLFWLTKREKGDCLGRKKFQVKFMSVILNWLLWSRGAQWSTFSKPEAVSVSAAAAAAAAAGHICFTEDPACFDSEQQTEYAISSLSTMHTRHMTQF